MKKSWKGTAVSIIVFMISFASIPIIVHSETDQSEPQISVQWQLQEEEQNQLFNISNHNWEFTDKVPRFDILYQNGTRIIVKDYYVKRGNVLQFVVTIPKSILKETRCQLDRVQIHIYSDDMSDEILIVYVASETSWELDASIFEFDEDSSSVSENIWTTNITFVGEFSEAALTGTYWANFKMFDTLGRIYGNPSSPHPIGLECLSGDLEKLGPKPTYSIQILDESLKPTRRAKPGEPLIFELNMQREIGYAFLELGEISNVPSKYIQYFAPMNWSDPNTDFYIYSEESRSPHLGFEYNATLNEARAIIFYINFTTKWTENDGWAGWVWDQQIIVDNTNLSDFCSFDMSYSGSYGPTCIRWRYVATAAVRSDAYQIPLSNHWNGHGALCYSLLGGIAAEPCYRIRENGVILNYNSLTADFSIYKDSGRYAFRIDHGEWVNVSGLIYGSSNLLNSMGTPYLWEPSSTWYRRDFESSRVKFTFRFYEESENATHYFYYYSVSYAVFEIESSTITDQFCSIVNLTAEKSNPEYNRWISEVNSSTGLPDLIEVDNASLSLSENCSFISFMARILEPAPSITYSFDVGVHQNSSLYESSGDENGPWTLVASDWNELTFGHPEGTWIPNQIAIGTVNIYSWWITTDDGLLDLDGNLGTEDDQYIIKHYYEYSENSSRSTNVLSVDFTFNPTPSANQQGDEFISNNWMGLITHKIIYNWNSTYIWYHASDMSIIDDEERAWIDSMVWLNKENRIPNRWYGGIAWMTLNSDSDDFVDSWWLEDNIWEVSWFGFGTEQKFKASLGANETTSAILRSEFAGMLLFRENSSVGTNGIPDFVISEGIADSDEATHLFLINDVDGIEFTLPFNSSESMGDVVMGADSDVEFGVRLDGVNGTLYPLHSLYVDGISGCWDYLQSPQTILGVDSADFDHTISDTTINEMAFTLHYAVYLANTSYNPNAHSHLVEVKVDQCIGDWTFSRYDNSIVQSYGLATAYFAEIVTETTSTFYVNETRSIDNEGSSQIGDVYRFGTDNNTCASVLMGGQSYIWGKNQGLYNSSASTVPLGTFSDMYVSEMGMTITQWILRTSYYFMLTSFSNWEGYSIDNDPTIKTFTAALTFMSEPTNRTPTSSIDQNYLPVELIFLVTGLSILFVIVLVIVQRRKVM